MDGLLIARGEQRFTMPVLRCDEHGSVGAAFACPHLLDDLELDHLDALDESEDIGFGVLLCKTCCSCTDVRELDPSREGFAAAWTQLTSDVPDLGCWCGVCLDWATVRAARRAGRPDPFPVYDRTLGYRDREVLGELRQFLLARFEVPQSAMQPEQPALSVRWGNCHEPATVTVYGVTDEATIDAITTHVRAFFAAHERNQGRLILIEEQIVEHYETPHGIGGRGTRHRRDLERVLREDTFPEELASGRTPPDPPRDGHDVVSPDRKRTT